MKTWICRILAVVFLCNTVSADLCAQLLTTPRPQFDQKALEEQIGQKSQEELEKQERAELLRLLKSDDLSPRERRFAELELDIVNTQIECLERQCEAPLSKINQIPAVYVPRLKDLKAREDILEKEEALNDFYHQAESDAWIAAAVAALHTYSENAQDLSRQQDQAFVNARAELDFRTGRYLKDLLNNPADPYGLLSPTSTTNQKLPAPNFTGTPRVDLLSINSDYQPVDVLKLWENNEITLEDVIEHIDPVGKIYTGGTFDATRLMFAIFQMYNNSTDQLDAETKSNTVWVAKHLKQRVRHQLNRLQNSGETGAYLMLLLLEINKFLEKNDNEPANQAKEDRTVAGYDMITHELNEGLAASKNWKTGNPFQGLLNSVKQGLANKPSQDSAEFESLRRELSTVVTYILAEGGNLSQIAIELDKDGKEYHGYYEPFVSEFFTTMLDFVANFPSSYETQRHVQGMLLALASPEFKYNGKTYKNAVNVRVQALSMASMLREAADTHAPYTFQDVLAGKSFQPVQMQFLKPELFTDYSFRSAMAAYTVDVYAPTTTWNAAMMGYKDQEVERYGLTIGRSKETDELTELSNHLAHLFATFLPVMEPTSVWVKHVDGMYRGCSYRTVGAPAMLDHIVTANGHSLRQSHAVDADGNPTDIECPLDRYSNGADESPILVADSEGYVRSILSFGANPPHAYRVDMDIAESVLWEVFTWYLWGAAFKAIGWAWKAGKAAIVATRAIARGTVARGMQLARWESKFSQAWKFYNGGWKTEMGIIGKVESKGGYYTVEVARPGGRAMIVKVPSKGWFELRTLKGRIAFRRTLIREIEGVGKSAAGKGSSTTSNVANSFARPMTKVEQAAVKEEQVLVQSVKGELQKGSSFEQVVEESGVKIYRPAGANPYINPATAMPERRVLDAATGNFFGETSGAYLGTATGSANEATVAYDIARGLTEGGAATTSLAPTFTGRYLWKSMPVLKNWTGLAGMVGTFRLTDPIVYQFYLKPWQERVAEQQNAYLMNKHNIDKNGLETDTTPQNALERAQSIAAKDEELFYASRFSTISGMFVGANELMNKILPDWAIDARRSLFNWTANVTNFIDAPFNAFLPKSVTELAPTPGAALMMYPMLMGDPTPAIKQDGTASDAQYAQLASTQRLQRAMDGHDKKVYQEALDKEIKEMEKSSNEVLKDGTEIAVFLSALPNGKKEMKTAYQVYIQKLKEVRQKAETDVEAAQKMEEAAAKTFLNTQADIMKRAIQAFLKVEKAKTTQDLVVAFVNNFNTSGSQEVEDIDENETALVEGKPRDYFTKKHKKALESIINDYYKKKEQYLVDFYTAPSKSLNSNVSIDALQKTAQEALTQLEASRDARIQQLESTISSEVFNRNIASEMKTIKGNKEVNGSLESFLADPNNALFLKALPDGEKRIKQAYKTYEQALKTAQNTAKKDQNKGEKIYQDAIVKLINTQTEILCEAVDAFAEQNRAQELQEEVGTATTLFGVFFTENDKTQLEKIINDYWTAWKGELVKFYKAQQRGMLNSQDEQALEDQKLAAAQLDYLAEKIKDEKEKLQQTIINRLEDFSKKQQSAY